VTRRSRISGYGSALVLVVVGVLCAALFSRILGQVLAMVMIGLGLVVAVSLVFAEIGFGEDRERARQQRSDRGPEDRGRRRPSVPRLERRRGQRRRL
jgi:hypothetical protein